MYNLIILIPIINILVLFLFSNSIKYKNYIRLSNIIMILLTIMIFYEVIINNIIIKTKYYNYYDIINIEFIYNFNSVFMMLIIIGIYSIVIEYSIIYMKEDSDINRFIYILNIFMWTMLVLVISYNNILLYIGWELVGLTSYFLISFWYSKLENVKSGIKALLYNKIGDLFLIYSILLIIIIYDNDIVSYTFILAAMVKSAQIMYQGWLSDAMAGPTPVSSLLHAATMVTAGIYLLYKVNIPYNLLFSIIGLYTLLLAGMTALYQYDIKKIVAYSTCSQLGFLFYSTLIHINSFSHLIIHAFFKALLFMVSGFIIHYYYNIQDIRKYGSFINYFIIYYIFILLSSLSLIGFPFLSGNYTKELIIESSYFNSIFIYFISIIGSILTIIYSLRLIYITFYNKPNYKVHTHYSNLNIFFPILIIFSTIFGYYIINMFIMNNILYSLDLEYINLYIKYLPFYCIIFIFLLFLYSHINKFNYSLYINIYILHMLNKTFYIDLIYIKIIHYLNKLILKLYVIIEKYYFDIIFIYRI